MADRDWERELAKIDKQLASVSDDQLLQQGTVQRASVAPSAAAKPVASAKQTAPVAPTKGAGSWIAWVQLILAIAAAVSLWFWPWETRCGLNAVGFTAATGVVTALGLWSAVGSWKHRQGYAHVLSFAVMICGLVLGAREVLPRMGYAIPTEARPAGWRCEAPTSVPNPLPTPAGIPAPVNPPAGGGPLVIPSPIPPNGRQG